MKCVPGPWWDPVMKCWRTLDCKSKNRVHIACDSRNAPVSTVKDLMGANLVEGISLPPGWGSYGSALDGSDSTIPGQYAYGDEAPFGFNGFGHIGGFGVVPVGYASPYGGSLHFYVVDDHGGRPDGISPVESVSFPSEPVSPVLAVVPVPVTDTTTSTLQPLPEVQPTAVPEPAHLMGIWIAMFVVALMLRRDFWKTRKND